MKTEKSLYIHIPFCTKKCLFCSFAVSIGAAHRVDEYLNALEIDARQYQGSSIKTIYLGGGTPSFLSTVQMTRVIKMITEVFSVQDKASWSIEVNPEDINQESAQALVQFGFNRISMGVQSFNDAYLKFLGRVHDGTQAYRAFKLLRDAGMKNINIDLMYGFPGQTRAQLSADIEAVVVLQSEHVSIYTLTIEPNSRFYATQMKLDSDDKLADDYVFVTEGLERAGLNQYEVSNFARPGFESLHNKVYWQGGEYIGLGMGAHSFMEGKRSWNTGILPIYIEKINKEGKAIEDSETLSPRTLLHERLIFGLRMNQGIDVKELEVELQMPFDQKTKDELAMLVKEGFLACEDNHVMTTLKGRLVLDELATRLI